MKAFEINKLFKPIFQALQNNTEHEPDGRPYLRYVYHDAERKKLVATCGKSLFAWDIPETAAFDRLRDFLDGVRFLTYSKGFLLSEDVDMKFPDWWKVVPNTDKGYKDVPQALGCGGGKRQGDVKLFATILRSGMSVNFDYINVGTLIFSNVFIPESKYSSLPVVAKAPGMEFLIMPLMEV